MGVEIIYDTRVGKDISLAELKEKYDAVFLAPGAHRSKPMGVEGEDKGYKGFLTGGIDFLREAYWANRPAWARRSCVVGGGNTAIDCVRVALREGAEESILLYRRSRKEMPADVWEVDGADEEGVQFEFQVLPTKIIADESEPDHRRRVRQDGHWASRMPPDAAVPSRCRAANSSSSATRSSRPSARIRTSPSSRPTCGIDITKWNTVVTKYVPLKGLTARTSRTAWGTSSPAP